MEVLAWLNSSERVKRKFEELGEDLEISVPSTDKAPTLELKQLPMHLKYVFLGNDSTLPVIISADLTPVEEEKLLRILRVHRGAIG